MSRLLSLAFVIGLVAGVNPATAQTPAAAPAPAAAQGRGPGGASGAPARPPAPTRDPHTAGYVAAKELPDGTIPPPNVDGNFILGPTHTAAAEMTAKDGVPQGAIFNFTMESTDSKFYSGVARENPPAGTPPPAPGAPRVVSSHPAPYTRKVTVYVPKQYVPGTVAPLLVNADGGNPRDALFTALDNLIDQHRIPVMVCVSIGNGSGDGPGSERGLEYGGEDSQRETDQRSRCPGHDGRQFRRLRSPGDGVVSQRSLPSRSHLLGHLREQPVPGQSRSSPWRLGVA